MDSEMQIIKSRLVKLLFSGYYESNASPLSEHLLAEDEESDSLYWTDVDYSEKLTASYSASIHIDRILKAVCYGGSQRLQEDVLWRNQLIKLLRYWLKHDFCSMGWFHNQIGNPKLMANLMLLLEPWIPDDLKEIMLERISRGSLKLPPVERQTYVTRRHPTEWTGANLIWGATTTLKHAVLISDAALLERAVQWVGTALKYDAEGVQLDGGFCQHGPRWYSGGYGAAFTMEIAPLIYCVQDTKYAFSKEKIDVLLCHVLDGQRRMQHRGYFDYGAIGRQMSRPANIHAGRLTNAIALLSQIDYLPRKMELLDFLAELQGEKECDKGTKYYESICLMQHSAKGGYISIRGSRPDIYGAEKTNNEGLLCYNMSYGTNTCFMHSGKEYYDISPVWDFCKIPGTTARQESEEQLKNHGDWDVLFRKKNECQSVVIGDNGILKQNVEHDGISLKISYFVFDGCMVALGTDICDESSELGAVVTTVEQSVADNPMVLSVSEAVNCGWRYRNLDCTTEFNYTIGPVTGSWYRNNPSKSKEPVTKDIFTVTIPVDADRSSYAYLVSPKEWNGIVRVLRNDSDCQAILVNESTVMIACWRDMDMTLQGNALECHSGEMIILELT